MFKKGQKAWNKGKKIRYSKICEKCGKEYFVIKSSINHKYCSWDCYSSINTERVRLMGKNNKIYKNKEERHQANLLSGRKSYRKNIKTRIFYYRQLSYKRRTAVGSHSLDDWEKLKEKYNHTCPCCLKAEPEIKLTEDHIVPISIWEDWIKENKVNYNCNDIENIQPLCGYCNNKKHTKIVYYSQPNLIEQFLHK